VSIGEKIRYNLRPLFGFVLKTLERIGIKPIRYEKMFGLGISGTVEGRQEQEWYNSYHVTNKNRVKFEAQRLADIIKKLSPKSVLELGCGFGYMLNVVQKSTGAKCTGVDMQKNAITLGEKLYPKLNLICDNCSDYRPKNNFDVVMTSSFLAYTNKKTTKICIDSCAPVTKYFVICETVGRHLTNRQYMLAVSGYNYHNYDKMMEHNGFSKVAEILPEGDDIRTILVYEKN